MTAAAVAIGWLPLAVAAPADDPTTDVESNKAKADALSEQAVERFNARDFAAAVDLFEQAYALDAQANYLFNIGRVYEEQGDLANAVEYYQRFVGSQGVDLDARHNATERLEVLKQALEALEPEPEPEPEPKPEPDPAPEVTDPNDGTGDDGGSRKRSLRIAGYTLLGVGGGALIVGGVFGGLALGSSNSADEERFVDDALSLRDRARTQARVADAMFITGGVLAATGLVLVLTTVGGKKRSDTARHSPQRTRRGSASASAVLAPWAARRSAGLSLAGRF